MLIASVRIPNRRVGFSPVCVPARTLHRIAMVLLHWITRLLLDRISRLLWISRLLPLPLLVWIVHRLPWRRRLLLNNYRLRLGLFLVVAVATFLAQETATKAQQNLAQTIAQIYKPLRNVISWLRHRYHSDVTYHLHTF